MPVRILHVEGNADGTVGGSHRALVDLALGMDRTRFEPVVLFYQTNKHVETLRARGVEVLLYDQEREREVHIRRTQGQLRKTIDKVGAVARRVAFMRKHRIGLLHLNNSPLFGFSDWLPAARICRIPCMTFAMGDADIRRPYNRWFARRFDYVLACSRYMEQAMRAIGVADDRLGWTYLGIDVPHLHSLVSRPPAETRRALEVAEDGVLVVMIGNLREWKGQLVVLEALRLVEPDIRRRLHVRFVGAAAPSDAPFVQQIEHAIAALDTRDQVRILGPRDDVPTLLAAADIAVHASLMPEPFGLVVPEAMAQGAAIVASKFGGPGEVLTTETGLTFDPARPAELAAHLTDLVRDPVKRRRLGDAAKARAAQPDLSIAAMVARVEAVYEKLLA